MKISRVVRLQLTIFTVVAVVSTVFTGISYLRIPAALDIGRYRVTVELPRVGGLYRNANVTYDGHTIGRVTSVDLTPGGVTATLSLIDSVDVPTDLTARVRSMSAIGEQYVDLQPAAGHGPYLRDGARITADRVRVADRIGPILEQTRAILASLPPDTLHTVLDETARGIGGAGTTLATLLDSTTTFVDALSANGDAVTTLVQQLTPLLRTQLVSDSEIRSWAANLADLTEQLNAADPALRGILQRAPGAADDANQLFQNLAPTLPVLLTNLTTVGQVALTYNPAIEEVLVLLPPMLAAQNTAGKRGVPEGAVNVIFSVEVQDPAACTTGYLSADQRRSPTATDTPDTPTDLYCNVPQDSQFSVRGMRNLPCLENPGVRAATPEQCRSGVRPPSGDNGPFEVGPPAAAGPPPVSAPGTEGGPGTGSPLGAAPAAGSPPGTGVAPGAATALGTATPPGDGAPPEPGATAAAPDPGASAPGTASRPTTAARPGAAPEPSAPQPGAAGIARYLPGSPMYVGPDGTPYRHIEIEPQPDRSPSQDPPWTSLLTAPIP
ncbi:MCE family protein [Nocardia sp. BMG51109]|uniref:MCE family protein n=1 Tax=Nocardia sp. BMG51109 TaxID=1056816 RepID=UPI000462E8F2|nr:MlaD family protein [Nocardia sp. BMG51109]